MARAAPAVKGIAARPCARYTGRMRDASRCAPFLGPHLSGATRADLEALADSPAIFQRGADYACTGRVLTCLASGYTIRARVRGQGGDYDVTVTDTPDSLEMTCDCPYDGPVCKHIVAVLLDALEHEDDDDDTPVYLDDVLAAMPRSALLDLLYDMMNLRPDVRDLLMTLLPINRPDARRCSRDPVEVAALLALIEYFFAQVPFRLAYEEPDVLPAPCCPPISLTEVFDRAATLHPLDRMEVYWSIVELAHTRDARKAIPEAAHALRRYALAVREATRDDEVRRAAGDTLLELLPWAQTDPRLVDALRDGIYALCDTPEGAKTLIAYEQLIRK
jgi:hypothetical protein